MSRPIEGTIKTVIIKRDNLGDFYICISLEQEESQSRAATGKSVGIDFGLTTFLTLSDTLKIEAPLYHLKNLKQLKKLNRGLSKKKKGSEKRKQAKLKLAKLHIKIANQRKDYFHKLSNKLASNYDHIFIEDLNMKAMQKIWGRKVSDLGFAELINILIYKANVEKIDRFYPSSKTCSVCRAVNHEINSDLNQLKNRIFKCKSCGHELCKDHNASLNIERVGASTLSIEDVRPAFVG